MQRDQPYTFPVEVLNRNVAEEALLGVERLSALALK